MEEEIFQSLAEKIETCERRTLMAIERAEAGNVRLASHWYALAELENHDIMPLHEKLWDACCGRLNNKEEFALLEKSEDALYADMEKARFAINNRMKI